MALKYVSCISHNIYNFSPMRWVIETLPPEPMMVNESKSLLTPGLNTWSFFVPAGMSSSCLDDGEKKFNVHSTVRESGLILKSHCCYITMLLWMFWPWDMSWKYPVVWREEPFQAQITTRHCTLATKWNHLTLHITNLGHWYLLEPHPLPLLSQLSAHLVHEDWVVHHEV